MLAIPRRLSRSTASRFRSMPSSQGFTLVELLVVLAIIAVLISALMPALTVVRRRAQDLNCASQQRQIGLAIAMYLNANRNMLPFNDRYSSSIYTAAGSHYDNYSWPAHYTGLGLLYEQRYLGSAKVLWCPTPIRNINEAMSYHFSATNKFGTFTNPDPASTECYTTYRYRLGISSDLKNNTVANGGSYRYQATQRASRVKYPDNALVFCGASSVNSGGNSTLYPREIHQYRGFNILMLDGSVNWFSFKEHPNFPNTAYPQCGQQVGSPNAGSDSYGNRYRRDFSWTTMRRAGLVFNNRWTNGQSSGTFIP